MDSGSGLRRHVPSAAFVLVVVIGFAAVAGIYIYLGAFNIGADAPHSKLVYGTLDKLRERSIAAGRARVKLPLPVRKKTRFTF